MEPFQLSRLGEPQLCWMLVSDHYRDRDTLVPKCKEVARNVVPYLEDALVPSPGWHKLCVSAIPALGRWEMQDLEVQSSRSL